MKRLMDSLYEGRREWILYKSPSVQEILEKFPPLTNSKMVRYGCITYIL